jgi:hypothetical protein
MPRKNARLAIALISSTLLVGNLLLAGCGRTAIDPSAPLATASPAPGASLDPGTAPGDTPSSDPGTPPGTDPGTPPAPGSNPNASPAPQAPGTPPPPAPPAPAAPGGWTPITPPTPTPQMDPPNLPGPSAPQPLDPFTGGLRNLGYINANSYDIRLQLAPLLRVPTARFHWAGDRNFGPADPPLGLTYQLRFGGFPMPLAMGNWQRGGYQLALTTQNVSFYIAPAALYSTVHADRNNRNQLIFYKRQNGTGASVSYDQNGTIDDYAYFSPTALSQLIQVPAAFIQ